MSSAPEPLSLILLRKKDAHEFARFVHLHEGLVMSLCQTLGLSSADADDTAAETFAIAYRALEKFRGDSQLSTWLYRIAYRTAIKVRNRYAQKAGELPDIPDHTAPPAADLQETKDALWAAVTALDPDQAAAVELFYRREMSIDDIAGIMEKPTGTIKTLLHRARERLRFLLKNLESP